MKLIPLIMMIIVLILAYLAFKSPLLSLNLSQFSLTYLKSFSFLSHK